MYHVYQCTDMYLNLKNVKQKKNKELRKKLKEYKCVETYEFSPTLKRKGSGFYKILFLGKSSMT